MLEISRPNGICITGAWANGAKTAVLSKCGANWESGIRPGEAHHGQIEVILQDGTRSDCLTETHAIEFDFGGS